ncbi:MAG: hypothetical protein HQL35_12045, partial [Alphaproteobacteria bacterium]|nr:hypothetical protein [Alphaproteobacteria bacterium]
MKRMYHTLRRIGHPVLWVALGASLYGNHHYRDRLYWETPSIPFRPFCSPKNDWEPSRPVKGISPTHAFTVAAVDAMGLHGVTLNSTYFVEKGERDTPILVAPRDFENSMTMMAVTRAAIAHTMGINEKNIHSDYFFLDDDGKVREDKIRVKKLGNVSLVCEDIEAEGSPYIFGTTLPDY